MITNINALVNMTSGPAGSATNAETVIPTIAEIIPNNPAAAPNCPRVLLRFLAAAAWLFVGHGARAVIHGGDEAALSRVEDEIRQADMFSKELAIIGGLLYVAVLGGGRFSIDAPLRK